MPLPILGAIAIADVAVTALTGKDIVQHVTGYDWMGSAAAAIDNAAGTNLYEYLGGDGSGIIGAVTGQTVEFENGSLLDWVTGGNGGKQFNTYPDGYGEGSAEASEAASGESGTIIQAIQDAYDSIIDNMSYGFQTLSSSFSEGLSALGDLMNYWGNTLLIVGVVGVGVGLLSLFSNLRTRKKLLRRFRR